MPKKVIKNKFKFPIWFDNELKQNVIEKRRAHRIYRDSGTVENYLVFSNLRALCNEQAQMCYNNYILDVQQGVQPDPKNNFFGGMCTPKLLIMRYHLPCDIMI